jgi:hypothetical protein
MKDVQFGTKPKPFMNESKYPKPKTAHAKHEAREGVYGEYEEDVKEYASKHPANKNVTNVSLWTLHKKGQ